MIRSIIFVLLAISGWGKSPEKNKPADSLRLEPSLRTTPGAVRLNQRLNRLPPCTTLNLPAPAWSIQKQHSTSSQNEAAGKERYLIVGTTSGGWFPTGHNRILGPHPSLGFVYGRWYGQWLIEFQCEFRINRALQDYRVFYDDTLRTTHQYFGYFLGIHLGYGIVNFRSSTFYVLGGLGADGFDSVEDYVKSEDNDNRSNVEFDSFNLNAGFGFQHFPKRGGYWGIEFLYNLIHYRDPGGTPLDGNALTLRLTYGFIARKY